MGGIFSTIKYQIIKSAISSREIGGNYSLSSATKSPHHTSQSVHYCRDSSKLEYQLLPPGTMGILCTIATHCGMQESPLQFIFILILLECRCWICYTDYLDSLVVNQDPLYMGPTSDPFLVLNRYPLWRARESLVYRARPSLTLQESERGSSRCY